MIAEYVTADGEPITQGMFVRVATGITAGIPTAYANEETGKRPIDFGCVIGLLDDGVVDVNWFSDYEPVAEKPHDLQQTTKEQAEAFRYGHDQGFEVGYRDGVMTQMNSVRASVGLPLLTDEEFEQVVSMVCD